jgi:2,3-bisphosphoglycerate-independent phosphoglycerate mutase
MSALELTDKLTQAIRIGRYDTIICNYANGDMVGHTGMLQPAQQAVETLDHCLKRLCEALNDVGGQMLVTADHGNVEQMSDPETDQAHTAHTNNPVPLVYVGPQTVVFSEADGTLSDVAPTLLDLMHLDIPQEMTGRSLVTIEARQRA